MSPLLVWEGAGEVPNFCPEGCGGITEDVYGGPCKACWARVDELRRADAAAVLDDDIDDEECE